MTLTVPKAGVQAGRSASIQREPSQVGAALDDFGAVMKGVGDRLEADRLDREAGQHRIDMARELGELRLEFEQMNDPDRIDREWAPRVAEIRGRYQEGTRDDGRAMVDVRHRERVLQGFDDLANRHTLAVGARGIEARRVQRTANWMRLEDEVIRQSAAADPETRKALVSLGLEQIADDVESGAIDPVEAEKRRQSLIGGSDEAVAISVVDADPQGFLDRSEAGEFTGLSERVASALTGRARERAARVDRDEQRAVAARLDAIADAAFTPEVPVDHAFLESDLARAHPAHERAMARLDLAAEFPDLPRLPPDDMRAIRTDHAARRSVLDEMAAAAEMGYARDPIAQARLVGLDVPDLPEFEDDPAGFADALAGRVSMAMRLGEDGYTPVPAPLLSGDEGEALAERLAGDPGAEQGIAEAVKARFGDEALDVLAGLGIDPAPHDPDRAGVIARRLMRDPDAARLARARQYLPVTPEAVADMDRRLAALDAAAPEDRPALLEAELEDVARRRRAGLDRPLYYGGGEVSLDGLKATAARLVQMRRGGRIDPTTYAAQAALLRSWVETFDG